MFGSCWDDLMIVSGTVFNEILLWHVKDESPGPKSQVCIRVSYTGHQVFGSLFIFLLMVLGCFLGGNIFSEGE